MIHREYARHILRKKAVQYNAIAITFDDGPGDRVTLEIIRLFDEKDAKATFFLSGRSIPGREEIVRQIQEQGHQICSHGYNHLNYWRVSPLRAIADIRQGWETIDAALEHKQKKYPFRPPYGKLNAICLLYLLIKKVPIIYWTNDSGDSWKIKPDRGKIANEVAQNGGMVILAHDYNRKDKTKEPWILESVRLALEAAAEKGLRAITISELFSGGK
ncbi:MAG: polysaccharide deacetylase family protein [Sedimentisphaerales bacterium]|nr:polysaccharide deacetylase family protein [Sedimentisphaerales bacterium]